MNSERENALRRVEMKDFEPETIAEIYGGIDRQVDMSNTAARLRIGPGDKPGTIKWESSGLIVSFNGGGDVRADSATFRESAELSAAIVQAGGLVLNGGRHTGVMESTAAGAGEHGLGVVFPEQITKGVVNKHGEKLAADNPITRLALLTNLPSRVVVYEGGIGTLHELVNAMIAVKNTQYGLPAPQILAAENWRKPLEGLAEQGVVPKKYLEAIKFFGTTEEAKQELDI